MSRTARAIAHSNIALVKYWGKRDSSDPSLNLPAVGSISLTLGGLTTDTTVSFDDTLEDDRLLRSGQPAAERELVRVRAFLDRVRAMAGLEARASVDTRNDFPTGAGLASSASGFAALAVAATKAAGLDLDAPDLSRLARCGSGSAARSIFRGIVELARGDRDDGSDCVAHEIAPPDRWPLSVIVAVTALGEKAVGSGQGMRRTAVTSPYYPAWVDSHPADLDEARAAIAQRDFDRLATVTERSSLKMHASMMTSDPPLLYWNPGTVQALGAVTAMRAEGIPVCSTIDAGPQVKAVCETASVDRVRERLASLDLVKDVLVSDLGAGAREIPVDEAADGVGSASRPQSGSSPS